MCAAVSENPLSRRPHKPARVRRLTAPPAHPRPRQTASKSSTQMLGPSHKERGENDKLKHLKKSKFDKFLHSPYKYGPNQMSFSFFPFSSLYEETEMSDSLQHPTAETRAGLCVSLQDSCRDRGRGRTSRVFHLTHQRRLQKHLHYL